MAPRQNTFTLVPNPMGVQGLISRPEAGVVSKPPMTSKQAQKLYRQATRQPRLSKAEQRRIEREEQERIRKELDKDKQAAKARIAREKKKAKEQQALEERRKKGLPLVGVRPSQDTISRFIRGNGMGNKRDSSSTKVHLETVNEDDRSAIESEKENQPPGKKQRTSQPLSQRTENKGISQEKVGGADTVPAILAAKSQLGKTPRISDIPERNENSQPEQEAPPAFEEIRGVALIATPALASSSRAKALGNKEHTKRRNEGKGVAFPVRPRGANNGPATFGGDTEPVTSSNSGKVANPPPQVASLAASQPPVEPPRKRETAKSPAGPADGSKKGKSTPSAPPHAPQPAENQAMRANDALLKTRLAGPATEPLSQGQIPRPGVPPPRLAVSATPLFAPGPRVSLRLDKSFITPQSNARQKVTVKPGVVVSTRPTPGPKPPKPPVLHSPLHKTISTPIRPAVTPKTANPGSTYMPARPGAPRLRPVAPPVFRPIGAAARSAVETPKFLPKHLQPPSKSGTLSTPYLVTTNGRHLQTMHDGGPPTSTQIFLATHIDDLLPTPSQEARELQETIPPLPVAAANTSPKRPPVPLFRPNLKSQARTLARQIAHASPLRPDPAPKLEDFGLSFISTQDLFLSSQDIRDVEQSAETPSKVKGMSNQLVSSNGEPQQKRGPPVLASKFMANDIATKHRTSPCNVQASNTSTPVIRPQQAAVKRTSQPGPSPPRMASRSAATNARPALPGHSSLADGESQAGGAPNPKLQTSQPRTRRSIPPLKPTPSAESPSTAPSSASLPSFSTSYRKPATLVEEPESSSNSRGRQRFFGSSGAGLCELQTILALKQSEKTFAEEEWRREQEFYQLDNLQEAPIDALVPSSQSEYRNLETHKHGQDRKAKPSQVSELNGSSPSNCAVSTRQPKPGPVPSQESDYGDFDLDLMDWPAI